MQLKSTEVIVLLKLIGNNLVLGRSIENSLYNAFHNFSSEFFNLDYYIRLINIGKSYSEIFSELASHTNDKSLARIWLLLSKITIISSFESGEKLLEMANNLEKNNKLIEKQKAIMKSQQYKILILGSMTSVFLGVIAGLAPLFITFISFFRNLSISNTTIILIPISLYLISSFSIYFISDIALGKFNYKHLLFSTIAYISSYFIAKYLLLLIL